jgi:hypothetical protein
LHSLYTCIQLKSIYNAIQNYQGASGVGWSDEFGANVKTEGEVAVWDDYVTKKVCCLRILHYFDKH